MPSTSCPIFTAGRSEVGGEILQDSSSLGNDEESFQKAKVLTGTISLHGDLVD
jgi:hypothetical protein